MDRSRFKRREIQTRPAKTTPAFVDSLVVKKAASVQPQNVRPTPVMPVRPRPVAPKPAQVRHWTGLDMDLPGVNSRGGQFGVVLRQARLKIARRWALRGAAATVVIVLAVGGFLFSQGILKLHKVFRGGAAPVAALHANVNPNQLKTEGDGRINVLLLGRGGGNHDAPDLTDTMILASIDPVNHTQTLISIPRDLWVDVPNQGAMKINAAWETGEFKYLGKVAPGSTNPQAIAAGFSEVDQVVESVTGVPIDYNIIINFQAFQQAINTVGGVTVNVPEDLADPTMAWENGGNPVLAKAGTANFDGAAALRYVRSRETTSDFARAQRQRAVLVALKGKVATLGTLSNPLKIAALLNNFGDNVQSDLNLSEANQLYGIISKITDVNTKSVGFADPPNSYVTTGNMAGQSIVLPRAGLFSYSDIQNFLRTQLPDGYLIKENAPILVLNGTTMPGAAGNLADQLKKYGYNVLPAADAPTNNYGHTYVIDLSHGKDKYTRHYLEQRFSAKALTGLPDTAIKPNGAAFVIIVGEDEALSQQTQAN